MAKIVNLNLRQGETFRWSPVVLLAAPVEGEPQVPMDLVDCKARAQFREKYGKPVLAEISTEVGGIVVGPEEGRLHIVLTAEQTDALGATASAMKPRTAAVWDLEVEYPGGDVRRLFQGDVAISPNITRGEA